jgi:GT2 family glycosyltransferase
LNPIGVVIVSYNTRSLLAQCLDSLQRASDGYHLTVVVVDNGSSDGSVEMVQRNYPAISLLPMGENLGFAAATNRGLQWLGAGGEPPSANPPTNTANALASPPDYYLLLNPDTIVHTGAIAALVQFLNAHPRVGVVSPRLLNPDGSMQRAAFRFPTLMRTVLDLFPPGEVLPGRLYDSWWHGRYPQESGEHPFAIDHPLGACMLVRGRTTYEAGLLDERYFMYSEEIEWCWRIRRAGWAIWQEPAAHITHVGGASTSQFRHRMLIALYRSRLRFFAQHSSRMVFGLHRLIIRLGMLRAILRTWWLYGKGALDQDEVRARVWAYSEILRS